jgi:carbonic anhydrase/acetyltransferase-like protein (isoleucine patch superfamily)
MVPSVLVLLESMPLTPNGKVNRKALEAMDVGSAAAAGTRTEYVAPRTVLETQLAVVFAEVLGVDRVGIHDDFFDLGGHSLLAMRLLASVREIFPGADLRMLTQGPNVSAFSQMINQLKSRDQAPTESVVELPGEMQNNPGAPLHPWLFGAFQFLGILFAQVLAMTLFTVPYLLSDLFLHRARIEGLMNHTVAWIVGMLILPVWIWLGVLAYLLLIVAAKWALVGRVKPGYYTLFGWFHLRWWMKNTLLKIYTTHIALDMIQATPCIVWFYRALGADIGQNVYLDSPAEGGPAEAMTKILDADLIGVGSGARVEARHLLAHVYEHTLPTGVASQARAATEASRLLPRTNKQEVQLVLRKVRIGANAYVHHAMINSGVRVGEDVQVQPGSNVPPCTSLESHSVYEGAPIVRMGDRSKAQPVYRNDCLDILLRVIGSYMVGLCFVAMANVYVQMFIRIEKLVAIWHDDSMIVLSSFMRAMLILPSSGAFIVIVVVVRWAVVGNIAAGTHTLTAALAAKIWFTDRLMGPFMTRSVGFFFGITSMPTLLWALGAKVGSRNLMGFPRLRLGMNLLEISDDAKLGGGLWFQNFELVGSTATFKAICLGSEISCGHAAYFAPGVLVKPRAQLGGLTYTQSDMVLEEDTSYLGSPPMAFGKSNTGSDRRSRVAAFAQLSFARAGVSSAEAIGASMLHRSTTATAATAEVSAEPSPLFIRWLQFSDVCLQIMLLPIFTGALLAPPLCGFRLLVAHSVLYACAAVPLLLVASSVCVGLMLLCLKWAIVGRFIGNLDHWSLRARAIDVIGMMWGTAHGIALSWFQGTQIYTMLLRALGARIGKRVFFDTLAPMELDALVVGDDAVIDGCRIEPHTIDNGRMQFAEVEIGDKAVIGYGSVLSALTHAKERSEVLAGTYVMKGDVLPPGTAWVGNPAKISAPAQQTEIRLRLESVYKNPVSVL